VFGVNRCKDGTHRDGFHLTAQISPDRAQVRLVQWADFATVEFAAAGDDVACLSYQGAEILRPIHQGRERQGRGRAETDDADAAQVLSLEDGIDALGGAEHSRADTRGGLATSQHQVNGLNDARRHIRSSRGLGLGQHVMIVVEYDRVRIRAADIDAQP
jgi:hypothetical protein